MTNLLDPIGDGTDLTGVIQSANKNFAALDTEAFTKTLKGINGLNKSVQGKLPNNLGYGTILYDTTGKASIYMAVDNTGNPIFVIAKPGKDVFTDVLGM